MMTDDYINIFDYVTPLDWQRITDDADLEKAIDVIHDLIRSVARHKKFYDEDVEILQRRLVVMRYKWREDLVVARGFTGAEADRFIDVLLKQGLEKQDER